VVAAVDLAMAVGTGAIEDKASPGVLRSRRMTSLDVTLLTESRFGDLEQFFVVGAVGFVAIGAILRHRWVFPQKRTTLLGVTGVTVLVDGVGLEEVLGNAAMRIVTARAGHLAFPQGHVGGAHELRAALGMALPAGLDFGGLGELVALGVIVHDAVAIGAGQVPQLMGTALPVEARGFLVAVQTDGITLGDRRGVLLRKGDQALEGSPARLRMSLAGAVAVLAAEGFLGVSGVIEEELPHGCGSKALEGVCMAGLTGFRADEVSRGWLRGHSASRLDLALQQWRKCDDYSDEGNDENCNQHAPASVSHAEPLCLRCTSGKSLSSSFAIPDV
jgi:hypothetical protein